MLAEYIVSEADRIIKKYGTRDPYALCRAMKIRLREMDLRGRIKGYYFYQSRIENIVIDEGTSEPFRRILTAHELGHAVLHRETAMLKGFTELEMPLSCEKEDSLERDANLFAAELLIDDETVISSLKQNTFFEAAAALNVPAALLDYKFYIMHKKGYQLSDMQIARADFLRG